MHLNDQTITNGVDDSNQNRIVQNEIEQSVSQKMSKYGAT